MTEVIRLHARAKALAEREHMGARARALGRSDPGAPTRMFERQALVQQADIYMYTHTDSIGTGAEVACGVWRVGGTRSLTFPGRCPCLSAALTLLALGPRPNPKPKQVASFMNHC